MSKFDQLDITKALISVAINLLEYGAESILVEQSAIKLGHAFGVDSVEISMIPSAIVLSTNCGKNCITMTKRVHNKGINLSAITYILKMINEVEKRDLGIEYVRHALSLIKPKRYNNYLVAFMVGASSASFAYLQKGDLYAVGIVFFASFIAILIKQQIDKRHFIHPISFMIAAFCATSVASIALKLSQTPNIALAASVLFLFPGFPFINALMDSLKGYLSMGWGRWLLGSLLTFSVAIGIVLASSILHLKGW